ncbi:MAG TPA: ABC transporter substrate-binding protein [Ideonella sp.]|uniref:ABC transporter substrate-binding protein n=1 Tax=Ideonella sp. TaxID=1929293 RepID=UPI002C98FE56|nr:ABC transporter substrate-binding protein [Ideonella sp.]HSI47860.1 ABC transporter substrate-binding protein [Ideonella sp.]
MPIPSLPRRQVLAAGAGALLGAALPAAAQPGRATSRPLMVAQIFDTSTAQQDVSKDFLIGSRAAWQDINAKGGVRGRPVQHLSIEVDGTPASLQAALATVRDNPACVCLSGTAGDPVATQLAGLLRHEQLGIAHVAPWLQNSSLDVDERTFPIFAARQEQIGHALKSLTVMGVQEIGAVYASSREYELYHADLERIAGEFKLKLQSFRADGELVRLGQRLTQSTPAILLFVGGTPELVQFTQGLDKQSRQRYVVALADVNLQTMVQMGASRHTPVIATQAVPMVNAALPVVRAYRETLGRLFDEPPTPLSLAGFIAARYTFEVLSDVDGAMTRQSALAAFQRRGAVDVGGYRIAFNPQRRSATYVTQSMLTADGRVVG